MRTAIASSEACSGVPKGQRALGCQVLPIEPRALGLDRGQQDSQDLHQNRAGRNFSFTSCSISAKVSSVCSVTCCRYCHSDWSDFDRLAKAIWGNHHATFVSDSTPLTNCWTIGASHSSLCVHVNVCLCVCKYA